MPKETKTKRTTVEIKGSLLDDVRERARTEYRPITYIVKRALLEYLERATRKAARRKRSSGRRV